VKCMNAIPPTETKKLGEALVSIFAKHNLELDLIQKLINYEILLETSPNGLFRKNSLTTNVMSAYSLFVGKPYLKSILAPVLVDMITNVELNDYGYEIDPLKITNRDDLKQNISNLQNVVHDVMDKVLNSRVLMPKNFKIICNTLQTTSINKFPECKYTSLSGFFFLRYLVPAICSPEYFDIISFKIPDEARRGMLYLGKILQIIATEVQGTKETYMDCMNKLVLEYREVIQYWFDQLAKLPPSNSPQNIYDLNITNEEYQNGTSINCYPNRSKYR